MSDFSEQAPSPGQPSVQNVLSGTSGGAIQAGRIDSLVINPERLLHRRRAVLSISLVAVGVLIAAGITAATRPDIFRPKAQGVASPEVPLVAVSRVRPSINCGTGWVIPNPGERLIPLLVDETRPPDALLADDMTIEIAIHGLEGKAVVVEAVDVEVVNRKPSYRGVYLPFLCGSGLTVRPFEIDLSSPMPKLIPVRKQDADPQSDDPVNFPFKVSDVDPEHFRIDTRLPTGYVEWRLHVKWISGDRQGELVVDDGGSPFRSTSRVDSVAFCQTHHWRYWAPKAEKYPCDTRVKSSTARFAGTWRRGKGTLKINDVAEVELREETIIEQAPEFFPLVTLSIDSLDGDTATAWVVASDVPGFPVPETVTIRRVERGLALISPSGSVTEWCDDVHYERGDCGVR